jgi:ubiquitin thioesterase protein OTUB1
VHPDTQEPMDVDRFCSNYVDPLGKEAGKFIVSSVDVFSNPNHSLDNVSIEALCRALNLNVDVAYLNGSSDEVDFIKIRHDVESAPPISLLYR